MITETEVTTQTRWPSPTADRTASRQPPVAGPSRTGVLTRLTPNFFAIPFGLAGLAGMWRVMSDSYGTAPSVSDAVFLVAAATWVLILAGSVERLLTTPGAWLAELRHPVLAPFWALAFIVGMLLAIGLRPFAPTIAEAGFVAFATATLLFGGWLTGEWIAGELDQSKLHPGYFLPTVAGGLIAAQGFAGFGLTGLGWAAFGIGMFCWLLVGSLVLNRLMFVKMIPTPVVPTLAIELAPPAVAGNAYFLLHGSLPDPFLYALAGYTALMLLVQIRLLPLYRRSSFGPGFWAFTFSWAAAASFALRWLHAEQPPSETLYSALIAGAVSLLVAAIAVRSLLAVTRHQFLPPR